MLVSPFLATAKMDENQSNLTLPQSVTAATHPTLLSVIVATCSTSPQERVTRLTLCILSFPLKTKMSLALLQGYSSAEDEEENDLQLLEEQISSDDDANDAVSKTRSYQPLFDPYPQASSSLPSAFDAFSEISGPPQFLNNSVEDQPKEEVQRWRHGGRRNRKDKKDLPSGAVVESKAQLVGIRERVRSDIENNAPSGPVGSAQGGKRAVTVSNPNAEDAAELLRMCLRCGIPKTYSHAKGIVCPMCGDHPPMDSDKEPVKKKGSTIKDKEKSKRMKGQSSHAAWKSETEMQLRQQFD